jgi:hypothetical protein
MGSYFLTVLEHSKTQTYSMPYSCANEGNQPNAGGQGTAVLESLFGCSTRCGADRRQKNVETPTAYFTWYVTVTGRWPKNGSACITVV